MTGGTIPRRATLADGVWVWAEGGALLSIPDAQARSEGWVIEADTPQPKPGARIVPAVEQFAHIKARLDQIEREAANA